MKQVLTNSPTGICGAVFVVAVDGEGDNAHDCVDEEGEDMTEFEEDCCEAVEGRKEGDESDGEHKRPWFWVVPSDGSWMSLGWTVLSLVFRGVAMMMLSHFSLDSWREGKYG